MDIMWVIFQYKKLYELYQTLSLLIFIRAATTETYKKI